MVPLTKKYFNAEASCVKQPKSQSEIAVVKWFAHLQRALVDWIPLHAEKDCTPFRSPATKFSRWGKGFCFQQSGSPVSKESAVAAFKKRLQDCYGQSFVSQALTLSGSSFSFASFLPHQILSELSPIGPPNKKPSHLSFQLTFLSHGTKKIHLTMGRGQYVRESYAIFTTSKTPKITGGAIPCTSYLFKQWRHLCFGHFLLLTCNGSTHQQQLQLLHLTPKKQPCLWALWPWPFHRSPTWNWEVEPFNLLLPRHESYAFHSSSCFGGTCLSSSCFVPWQQMISHVCKLKQQGDCLSTLLHQIYPPSLHIFHLFLSIRFLRIFQSQSDLHPSIPWDQWQSCADEASEGSSGVRNPLDASGLKQFICS